MTTHAPEPEDALLVLEQDIQGIERREIILVVDDSESIAARHNQELIRTAVNKLIDRQAELPQAPHTYLTVALLNNASICSSVPIAQAPRLTAENCVFDGMTPLYRTSYRALHFAEHLRTRHGNTCMVIVVVFTDGGDNASGDLHASDVRRVALRLWPTEHFIFGGLGVHDGETDFRQVFAAMGIPPQFIRTPADAAQEVEKDMDDISVSISMATTNFDHFRHTTRTGFRTPTS